MNIIGYIRTNYVFLGVVFLIFYLFLTCHCFLCSVVLSHYYYVQYYYTKIYKKFNLINTIHNTKGRRRRRRGDHKIIKCKERGDYDMTAIMLSLNYTHESNTELKQRVKEKKTKDNLCSVKL